MNVTDVWITMTDGVRLAATLYLPDGDGPFAGAPRGAAVPQGRPHGVVPRLVRPVRRRGRLRGLPARPARHRLVGRDGDRRVPRRRARRPARRHRVAGDAAVVERAGRDVRHVVLRVQLAAHGGRGRAGARSGRRDVRHRRPLHRRRPLPRRRAAGDRPHRLRALHGADERAAAGAGAVGRRVGGRVAPAHRRVTGVDARLAARAGRLADVAARFDPARTRATRGTSGSRARRCSSPAGPTAIATTRSARSSGCGVPWRLLAGPWSHKDPARARPGPNIDADREIIAFFDEHLRAGQPSVDAPAQVFVRGSVRPEPDLALHDGVWRDLSAGRRPVCAGSSTPAPTRPTTSTDDLDGPRRRRRGGVDLVRRRAAVGPAARPARRRRPVADVRLADRRAGRGARQRIGVAARPVVGSGRAPRGAVVRRVPRRHVGADHTRDPQPEPHRLLAGRPGRRRRPAPSPVTPGAWIDATARARGDDVDVDARPHAASRHRRERLAELLAAARSAHAQRRPCVDRAPRPRRRRARRIDARVRAGRRTAERRGRRCGVAHRARRARSRDAGPDPLRRALRGPARLVDRRRVRGRARRVDRRSGSGVGEGPRRVHDPLAGGDVLDRRHRRRASRTPTRSTSPSSSSPPTTASRSPPAPGASRSPARSDRPTQPNCLLQTRRRLI